MTVGHDGGIGVPQVGLGIDVIDGCGDVETASSRSSSRMTVLFGSAGVMLFGLGLGLFPARAAATAGFAFSFRPEPPCAGRGARIRSPLSSCPPTCRLRPRCLGGRVFRLAVILGHALHVEGAARRRRP